MRPVAEFITIAGVVAFSTILGEVLGRLVNHYLAKHWPHIWGRVSDES